RAGSLGKPGGPGQPGNPGIDGRGSLDKVLLLDRRIKTRELDQIILMEVLASGPDALPEVTGTDAGPGADEQTTLFLTAKDWRLHDFPVRYGWESPSRHQGVKGGRCEYRGVGGRNGGGNGGYSTSGSYGGYVRRKKDVRRRVKKALKTA
ncbi:hypothetical protein ANCDUO_23967, partial [Ancylostoma duodenale]